MCPECVPTIVYSRAMPPLPLQPPSGHVFRVERKRGAVWYAKYRLPDGHQAQKKIGPAWAERGRPPAGYYTKRQAEGWLRETLDQARRGTLPGAVRTGARLDDAAAEWLRYVEHDRDVKPSTLRHYRSTVNAHLLPAFAGQRIEDITTAQVEAWRAEPGRSERQTDQQPHPQQRDRRPPRRPRTLAQGLRAAVQPGG